ncbi:MAG TPA: hypothetical protein VHO70_01580 [Chitinispirillaceae bacterium]|nr:hypothetical protein [Chitinispirillaceae bacterium]
MLKIFFLLLMLYTTLYGNIKTEIPECINSYAENYLKSDEIKAVLNRLKFAQDIDSSIPMSEVSAGFPLKVYRINYCILDTCSPDINVDELIIPTGEWMVPFYWNGKAIYEMVLRLRNGSCKNIGSSDMNKKYFSIYDHLSQLSIFVKDQFPIIIQSGNQQYVHFPKLNRKNLKTVGYGRVETKDELNNRKKLNASNEIIKKMQAEYKAAKPANDSLINLRPELYYFFYNTEPGEE